MSSVSGARFKTVGGERKRRREQGNIVSVGMKHAAIISLGSYRAGRVCPFCASPVASSLNVCAACGRDTTASRRPCRECRRMTPSDERACWNCGARARIDARWKIPLVIFLSLLSLALMIAGRALR